MKKSRFTLYRVVVIGLMAAMVFVCTMFLGIRIPTPTGTTQLKTANAICPACSLRDACMPLVPRKSAARYLQSVLEGA